MRKVELENILHEMEPRLQEEIDRNSQWNNERKRFDQNTQDIMDQ
jgi:hypothetical protein